MILKINKENIKYGLIRFFSEVKKDKGTILLIFFLIAVLVISFILPYMYFGRLYGTDDYTHLFHTGKMASATSISSFYNNMIDEVSNTEAEINPFYYPFGLWLFGSELIKMTGLPALDAIMIFAILFFFLVIGTFYLYSGLFLKTQKQRILAVLFFMSMPNMALMALSYRPAVFVIPFLLVIIYAIFQEPVNLKLIPPMLISIFVIVISHTGTYIFLISVSITFFFLYCLIWGKFSRIVFFTILSSFIIYVISLSWFPQISYQYVAKSSFFVTIGDFFASKFNFILASDMGKVFYEQLFVGQQLVYAIIFGAIIFTIGWILLYVHKYIITFFSKSENAFPVTLPLQSLSHSVVSTPIWAGPVQCFFSLFGIFQLDSKGKCLLVSTLACTLLPNVFQTSSGIFTDTGALREVDYLIIIIPITAALGFWKLLTYFKESTHKHKNKLIAVLWIITLLSVILIPTLATSYYLPKIAGEDYIIDGMKWLGQTGNENSKVAGYGYRTVPIYTNMTDASYALQSGSETRRFVRLLNGIYFSGGKENADNLLTEYGARYILISDKILSNFGNSRQNVTTDKNYALDKIYSSDDYGIYEIGISPQMAVPKTFLAENTTIMSVGSTLEIESPSYKIVLDEKSPAIERIGTPKRNLLGEGFSTDTLTISEIVQKNMLINQYTISDLNFTYTIDGNQLLYSSILKSTDNSSEVRIGSMEVRYIFYPDSVKREYFIRNDWQGSVGSSQKHITLSTLFFTPLSDFVIDTDKGQKTRHIYESQDNVVMDDLFYDLYIHDNDVGTYIKFGSTSPSPSALGYKGSTMYNMSSIFFSQSETVNPGASLHITQYFAVGDENTAKGNIRNHDGISLSNYPNGITPVIFVGYRTPVSDQFNGDYGTNGYSLLNEYEIPYTEAINPLDIRMNTAALLENNSTSEKGNVTVELSPVNLKDIAAENIKIIGVQNTGINSFDDIETQRKNIETLFEYAQSEDTPMIGFMPTNLNYDLDTVKILVDNEIPLALAIPVNSPYEGMTQSGYRSPELAYYNGEPTDLVLFPVSYPLSTSLLYNPDTEGVFSSWENIMTQTVTNDEMALFIIRSDEIGNPLFADQFANLTDSAQETGLTFTTPDEIADHFRTLQLVEHEGTIKNDEAVISVTNRNNNVARAITFKVVMPALKKGGYKADNATITRNLIRGPWNWVYVTCDLNPQQSAYITISPANKKEDLFTDLSQRPIEGSQRISVKDKDGIPINNAIINVGLKQYITDKNGNAHILLTRGEHEITIQSPGFNTLHQVVDVKGRIYVIKNIFGNLWP